MASTMTVQVPIKLLSRNPGDSYSHDLQLYQNVPFGNITLEELQEICETRLKVLSLVERIHLQKLTMSVSQRRVALVEELHKQGIDEFARLINSSGCKSLTYMDIRARRRDHISHFMLRSTVAFNEYKKRWFFKQEARLFKWRFSSLNNEGIRQFMCINNFDFTLISQNEKENIREHLQMSSPNVSDVDNTKFYRVPFFYIANLIRKRKVFIMQGEAFVPEQEMAFVFVTHFRRILLSSFGVAREARANLYNDERFTRIFAYLENYIHIQSTVLVQEQEIQQYISLDQLDKLAETSYPLCMRVLHKALRKNHHLTHGGRVQYCLFLKGMGLSLSDTITFWKDEFTKIMDDTAFKEHKYTIRFIFGQEGSRRDYQPYTCLRILESTIGPRDYHGCPFKRMLHDILEDELTDCGFNALERSAIMKLSKDGQYSAACNKYYEIKHDCFDDNLFKHPNIYFNESMKHRTSNHSGEIYLILYVLNSLLFCINFKITLKLKIQKQEMRINHQNQNI
ncbi:PREDICTED: DNA primase large subunit-like [Cyphomyrmex costatus]|uniref:DNA primase large subunit n=1 Tax=Cyphomyrmex costatus TaxID=456900 RepID=A0A195D3Z5_9HYME|nr:PREDICTED: DNA primase large subunit-like [Cyphomyrmex costatus]KYN07625.1 DNA primase large subunit [Cyphomyrmex costatus]